MKPTLLVLAAGMGSRYGGLKQIDPIGPSGETIIDYSINDAIDAGFGKIVFVVRESFEEEFKDLFNKKLEGKIEAEYVTQEIEKVPSGCEYTPERSKPWGTGHAILMAKEAINEPFAVINADDYYGREAFFTMAEFLIKECSEKVFGMVGYRLKNTISEHGSVSRGVCNTDNSDHLLSVVERTQVEKKDDGIAYRDYHKWNFIDSQSIVSMNFWGFTPGVFSHLETQFTQFLKQYGQELKSEFYIPFVISEIISEGETNVKVLKSESQWFGVTYKEDKEKAISSINTLVQQGVYPAKLWSN
ncbi:sugar phosphate nucleotidyltransferase [uncultured Draconibacterium sp.]|uniref:nucleotidyltransferase family protein n=1 Tax=uncultured Draconibacterium sp. TaxID=1573823 RepID=UPI0029C63EFB|nr:sugar phosphate nucleotidyltransferase [uncultured Draconibacterium sp.]